MRIKRWAVGLVFSAFLATVVGIGLEGVWAQESTALTSTVSVGTPQLAAKGAGVYVPVVYTCTAGSGVTISDSYVYAEVQQAAKKNSIAVGQSYLQITAVCDGQPHTETVLVTSRIPGYGTPGVPFTKGPAIVTARFHASGNDSAGGEYGGYVETNAATTVETRVR